MITEGKAATDIFNSIRSTWQRVSPMVSVSIVAIAVYFGILATNLLDYTQNDLSKVVKNWPLAGIFLGLTFAFILVIQLIWYLSIRPKKTANGKIGILFAIDTENEVQRKRISQDFAVQFIRNITVDSSQKFDVQFIKDYYTNRINKNRDYVKTLLAKTGANLILFGRIEERKKSGKEMYVLRLEESVSHKPISLEESSAFGNEMRLVIPVETMFEISDEHTGFQFTSAVFGLASRYILGIAAFYSYNFEFAYQLHDGAGSIASQILKDSPEELGVKQIFARISKVMTREAQCASSIETLTKKNFRAGLFWAQRALANDPNDYSSRLLASTCYFRLGEIDKSVEEINLAGTNRNDFTWAWSKAFLLAYLGKLDESYHLYKSICGRPAVVNAPIQCEVFISEVLVEQPLKVELYYCLALINYLSKEDYILAQEFFTLFIEACEKTGQYRETVGYAKSMLKNSKKKAERG